MTSKKQRKVPELRFRGFTDDWEQRKLGDFYDFKNGLNKGKQSFGKGTPIVNFTDVFHNRHLYAAGLIGRVTLTDKEIKNFEVQRGDLFFTRTSETIEEIGYPAVMMDAPTNTTFSGFVLRGRAIQNDPVVNSFKAYVFFTEKFRQEMMKKSSMTTRALTSGTALKKMLFSFPKSTKEQEAVGDFMHLLDRTIALHQRKQSLLKKLKQGYLQKLFPQKGQQQPELRFPGFTDDWEQRKLAETASEFIGGGTPSTSVNEFWTGEIPWIQSSNLAENVVDRVAIDKKISENAILKTAAKKISSNSIAVVTRVGVGKLAFIPFEYATSQDFLSFSKLKVSPWFLVYLLSEKLAKWGNETQGTSIKGITKKELLSKKVLMPSDSMEEQAVGELLKKLDSTIALHQQEIDRLQQLKQGYLQKMFV